MAALIEEAFGKDHPDLYTLLGLKTVATSTQIKKAYHKKALEWHPDKNKASDAKVKFQAIGEVHRILSDVELRAEYDESGSIPGEHGPMDWRKYFAKVSRLGQNPNVVHIIHVYIYIW